MSLGITEEHRALAEAVRGWARQQVPPAAVRAAADQGGAAPARPAFWPQLAQQGLLGMHLPEEYGGGGYTLLEAAVAAAEAGRAMVPGPFLPTLLASTVVQGAAEPELAKQLLPGLADGSAIGAVALGTAGLTGEWVQDGLRVRGVPGPVLGPVLGGAVADRLVLGAATPEGETWFVADADRVTARALPSLDPTRPLAEVSLAELPQGELTVPAGRILTALTGETVRDYAAVLFAAEATGLAEWCLDEAVRYAKVREQFGRPIGQFQAIKHLCADMLVRVEVARAAAWDAARAGYDDAGRPLTAAVAAALAVEAAVTCGKDCIQVLGGIGFTWEHDAHLYLRRAVSLRQLLGGTGGRLRAVATLALAGQRRDLDLDLPESAEEYRGRVRAELAELAELSEPAELAELATAAGPDPAAATARLVEAGYAAPHLPRPWGRAADPVAQLVIDQELRAAGLAVPDPVIGRWVVPTLAGHGTPAQRERFIPATLRGEIVWCQLFSEPGAGSDLAALTTRAGRVDGGWRLTGQKVWTSLAREAQWAIALARTDPARPKHDGLTYFLVDMSTPGIEVRPLREITGDALFNEVFLTDVFVPDDCVVGEVNGGWRLARATLGNERVHMSSGPVMGSGVEGLLAHVAALRGDRPATGWPDAAVLERIGALVAEGQALALLAFRTTLRRLEGLEAGPASSVRKLVAMGHAQRIAELGLDLLGAEGATTRGTAAAWTHGFLASRALSIAGGTTEVQRNVVAERILGLPRDP
jgi:alkylation response protein AidB-like acyl-CoA dehydrogenase